jgi:hypothetical protein
MSSPQESAGPAPERVSFFSAPPALRYMSRKLFWGGVLFGAGFGIFLTAILVGFEVLRLTPDHWDHWVSVMVLACVLIGQSIAQRAVRAGQQPQPEKGAPGTNEAEPAAPDRGR